MSYPKGVNPSVNWGIKKNRPILSAYQVLFAMKILQDDEINPKALALTTA